MEQLTDDVRKKRYGQYFSGTTIANTLLALLPETASIKTAIDPMVGNGDMLEAVYRGIPSIKKICGIDIDHKATVDCRKRIPMAEIFDKSAFEADDILNFCDWDLVITNPPYVRYQLLNSNGDYGLPTGDEIRSQLKELILNASHINDDERRLFFNIAEKYSGLADMAVPSWILCALITKKQGYLAMVVPETWLNRDYALPIHYLLIKTFEILTVVKDVDSVWFDNASVRTCLVIARKRERVLPYSECTGCTYILEAGKTLLGCESLVDRLKYKGKMGIDAVKSILNANVNVRDSGIYGASLDTKRLFYNLEMHLNEMSWVIEEDKDVTKDKNVLPNELASIIGDRYDILNLEEMGWYVGQGLRTGANEFFYANVLMNDRQSGQVIIQTRSWNNKKITTSAENIRMAIQNRNEVPGLCIKSTYLKKCVLYFADAVAPSDIGKLASEVSDQYRILDSEVDAYIRCGEEYNIPKKEKRYCDLSAVKPNEKRSQNGYLRFWYMLPKLQKRHEPDLCISRLCGKTAECLYVDNDCRNVVVDANFITLWNTGTIDNMTMFALLNSTWFKCYMELIGTRMGGGALKIEANQVRRVLFPRLTANIQNRLSELGKQLLNDESNFDYVRKLIDEQLFSQFGNNTEEISKQFAILLEKKLVERGAI
ncbi:MAG: N-6 DNA methylase [Lachnospiraceae bacterium]|nr:N-6 DNA methylase [Lachnospiraceae bacterium]